MLVAENGVRWTTYSSALSALRKISGVLYDRMARLENRRGLRGRTSPVLNYEYWQRWDWSQRGEEWTLSEDWKQSLIDDVMLRYIEPGTDVLEIGPGAGRWTEALQPIANHLTVVDLSDRCIELCRRRFAHAQNMEFHVNDGRSLGAVPANSIDAVWSFDVFVHVGVPEIQAYVSEMGRVLRPGGRAVIHHAGAGRDEYANEVGLRSAMTAAMFADLVSSNGMTLLDQFDSWGPGGIHKTPTQWDVISVFQK
jgi:ubiquinone/menaquinone biosynthesis C-methylase UbiE